MKNESTMRQLPGATKISIQKEDEGHKEGIE